MNLVNITDNDLKLMYKLIKDEDGLTDDELEELTNKLDYCIKMIDLRNNYMDSVENVNNEYKNKLGKEEK